jgi:hypothetical protein
MNEHKQLPLNEHKQLPRFGEDGIPPSPHQSFAEELALRLLANVAEMLAPLTRKILWYAVLLAFLVSTFWTITLFTILQVWYK